MMRRIAWVGSLVVLVALVALARALPDANAASGYNPADPAQAAQYQRALALGVKAYVYGYPLLDTDRVFRSSTSVNVPNGAGGGPVNQFSHIRRFTNPSDRTVVAPNHDTLYSIAWLNLRPQPIVVHMPVVKGRFVVFELLDPYTENFVNIGSVGLAPGDYAVVAARLARAAAERRADDPLPVHAASGSSAAPTSGTPPTRRTFNGSRTSTRSLRSTAGGRTTGRRGRGTRTARRRRTRSPAPPPARTRSHSSTRSVLSCKQFPPPAADRPLLAQLATVGIGPGMRPSATPRSAPRPGRGCATRSLRATSR